MADPLRDNQEAVETLLRHDEVVDEIAAENERLREKLAAYRAAWGELYGDVLLDTRLTMNAIARRHGIEP